MKSPIPDLFSAENIIVRILQLNFPQSSAHDDCWCRTMSIRRTATAFIGPSRILRFKEVVEKTRRGRGSIPDLYLHRQHAKYKQDLSVFSPKSTLTPEANDGFFCFLQLDANSICRFPHN